MIYRIAIGIIVDGKWKFSHYAAEYELETLRVNVKGTVQEAVGVKRISGKLDGLVWKDVSETHKVEWGFVANGNKYYHNDICKSVTSLSSYDPIGTLFNIEYDNDTASFWLTSEHDSEIQISVLCPILDECIKVIGNINKIPEILEKS